MSQIPTSNQPMNRIKAMRFGAWFFLFNSLIVLLIALRYTKHISGIEGELTYIYIIFSTLSHFITLTFIPYLVLYLPIALLFPKKIILQVWGASIITLSLAILVIDTFVFDLYRLHINSFTLELLFGGAGTDIFSFHTTQYILVISAVLICWIAELAVFRILLKSADKWTFRGGKWIAAIVVLMMLSSHIIHAFAYAKGYRPITRISKCYPLCFPTTANRFLYRHGIVSPDKAQENLKQAMQSRSEDLRYPLNPIIADSTSNMNVLIVLLDSWTQNTLDSTIMPNVSEFSKRTLNFRNHYSGSNGTRTGVFSLFYSIPGLYWYDVLGANISPVLMDQFINNNYEIGLFASSSLGSPPFDRTVFSKVKNINLDTPGKSSHDRDIQITHDWLDFTNTYIESAREKPFFGFLFYDAMHAMTHPDDFDGPFQPALKYAPYEKLSNDMDPTTFYNLYKNVANFEDSLMNLVLNDLQDKGLLKNTVVIITGDHGQEFNENKKGYWGHNGNYSKEQVEVPLLIYIPQIEPAVYNHWTSHYDIVPTLMKELFHCTNEIKDYSIGKNLLDTTSREWLIVGSHDNFGIIEADRITTIYFDRSYDITDRQLNVLDTATLNSQLINEIMQLTNLYYP